MTDPNDETQASPDGPLLSASALRASPTLAWRDEQGTHTFTVRGRATAGSAQGVDLLVADRTVSRLHAELHVRAGGVWVRDLGSKNGTFIDGVLVEAGRVMPGGRVRLGSCELHVQPEPEAEPVELWPHRGFGPLVGVSTAMRELFARMATVSRSDVTILIQGETGSGKELVSRALHDGSARADGPFVVIDCAALAPSLLESELFGHAKGAFTGADRERKGAIEAANGGTLVLDEVGELPLAMQPRLLRVLEAHTVRRLGETDYRHVDVRVISSTHRDLARMVNAGTFREDLWFRLSVLPLVVPPLRERREDIPHLIAHFLGQPQCPLSPAELQRLVERAWMGNVRELRNFVERLRALGFDEAVALEMDEGSRTPAPPSPAPESVTAERPYKEAREEWLDRFERHYVRDLLERHGHNVAAAAQAAGLNRAYLYRLVSKHNL